MKEKRYKSSKGWNAKYDFPSYRSNLTRTLVTKLSRMSISLFLRSNLVMVRGQQLTLTLRKGNFINMIGTRKSHRTATLQSIEPTRLLQLPWLPVLYCLVDLIRYLDLGKENLLVKPPK